MKRYYLPLMALLSCAGIAYATGSITVTGYPPVPRTIKGGTGINIGADGTVTATGEAVSIGSQPFQNISTALHGKFLPLAGTAVNSADAQAYKGNSAPSGTEFSYLQGVTSAIQTQLNGKADASSLSTVATTGSYTDLANKPTIPSALSELSGDSTHQVVTDAEKTAWTGKQAALGFTPENAANKGAINGYPSLDSSGKIPTAQIPTLNQSTTGTAAGLTAAYIDWSLSSGGASIKNKPNLATVATSGNYSDLSGKPAPYTLPTASTTVLGGVKIDGSSIQIDGGGVIHSTVSAGVSSVNTQTGDVTLDINDIVGFDGYSTAVTNRINTKHDITAFNAYSTATQAKIDLKLDAANPTYSGTLSSTAGDGDHYSWDYNTTSCPTTNVPEGAKCTLPSGIYWYKSGAWTQTGMLPTYVLPAATADTIGGVKPGTALSVDGNGVLSVMLNSLGPSGLVTAGLAGDQTVSSGFAYVATATPWKATFNSYSSTKQTTIYAFGNYSGTLTAATGSKLYWSNPVTFTLQSSASARIKAGTRATVQMSGGKTLVSANQNLQRGLPIASVSPSTLAFGSVGTGTTSAPLTATLSNSGLANLIVGAPSITGTDAAKFAISSDACNGANVVPGATCLESVTFTPGAAAGGPYSAQLNLPHNAAGSPTVVALSGTGVMTTYADDFNRADAATLGSPWATTTGVQPFKVLTNQARATTNGVNNISYRSDVTSDNHCSQIKLVNSASSGGPAVRISPTATTWYVLNNNLVVKKVAGTDTTVGTVGSSAVGDTVKLCVSGTTLTAYRNGSPVGTFTDSSISTGYPGIFTSSSSNQYDDWAGETL